MLDAVLVQPDAVTGNPWFLRPNTLSNLGVPFPHYSGYSEHLSATEVLKRLQCYQLAMTQDDHMMLGTISLTLPTVQATRGTDLLGTKLTQWESSGGCSTVSPPT